MVNCFPDLPVKFDHILHVDSLDLPGIAIAEPVIRYFALIAISDYLSENAIVISNTIPPSLVIERGHRIQETCS